MANGALKTLFLPFEDGILPVPDAGSAWLFLGAEVERDIDPAWKDALTALQPFRPDYNALQKAGFQAVSRLEGGERFKGALILLGKHRGRNEAWLAQALRHVEAGGLIVVGGDKKLGIDSFRKTVERFAPITDRLSKHHAVAFWFTRPEAVDEAQAEALVAEPTLVDARFTTAPGMFSHTAIDKGSALLVKHFSGRISGHVADFGAGWGYLASEVLKHPDKLKSLALYEADFEALEAAKLNLAGATELPLSFHWHDVNGEAIAEIYDTIVMNPPFHAGRSADPTMGQGFIAAAAKRLKPGGRLLLVANCQMPYEAGLKALFRSVLPIEDTAGYKIIEAKK
ncbi:class I SAM-dependent methyltransferase [Phyllobacterium myrsinacearum]|uniref:Methyltransferase n=1 Tax=Phyllobacterium myrsinacearum TaxID=28101 RepID=A0A2S9JCU0_9HYPH|nr:class I SAM-dependent methyltransferase [Phyllobacterium myrsinacearum]PRD50648.1 methyltransferase [Phyllobacterium myrsinacearum]PWV94848.1 16S rRNA m(2)G 1207 methyltransferase [Phyllobacterium myrsinacearum]RZV07041.1 16S rRNA m(2)G 1207 methyltransferase [Phyllobacterium myrsinacearum]